VWSEKYISFRYADSFTPPALHCVGLFLTIVRDRRGIAIPHADVSAESLFPWARQFARERQSGDWIEVARMEDHLRFMPGMVDRECDLVLMREIVGHGRRARGLALHCGTVVKPALMIDISADQGVKLKRYYDTPQAQAHGETKHAVLGVFRHRLVA
jgi:hypothetical protein